MNVTFAAVAAMGLNHEIGNDNKLLWHIPAELKHFKALTMNKPVIMGNTTYKTLPSNLPGRSLIVVTRQRKPATCPSNVVYVHSLNEAYEEGLVQAQKTGATEVMIAGGASIYEGMAGLTDTLYLTTVHHTYPNADTHINMGAYGPLEDEWKLVKCEQHLGPLTYSTAVYLRRQHSLLSGQ